MAVKMDACMCYMQWADGERELNGDKEKPNISNLIIGTCLCCNVGQYKTITSKTIMPKTIMSKAIEFKTTRMFVSSANRTKSRSLPTFTTLLT